MVYDSAKWNNITLAFFLVDTFLELLIAFVLFCFVFCYFSVFHCWFLSRTLFLPHAFQYFLFSNLSVLVLSPLKTFLLELSIFLRPYGLCLSIAVLVRLSLSAPPMLNLMFSSLLVCSFFWHSTFSSSFLKENTWEEILLLVYLFENVFIQLSDLWSGLGICQSQLENCFH